MKWPPTLACGCLCSSPGKVIGDTHWSRPAYHPAGTLAGLSLPAEVLSESPSYCLSTYSTWRKLSAMFTRRKCSLLQRTMWKTKRPLWVFLSLSLLFPFLPSSFTLLNFICTILPSTFPSPPHVHMNAIVCFISKDSASWNFLLVFLKSQV